MGLLLIEGLSLIRSLGSPLKLVSLIAFIMMIGTSSPSSADIWGYVDSQGIAHLSDRQVNEGYLLFKKEAPRPDIEAFSPPPLFERSLANSAVIQVSAVLRAQFTPLIAQIAREYNLDAALLHAIITVESGYNPMAKSPAGAVGLMQLMPETAARYAVNNIWDPRENLHGGARYLRFLLGLFKNNLDLTLAAYNAGEKAVMQAGNRIPNYAETRAYVPSVLTHYDRYRGPGKYESDSASPAAGQTRQQLIR